MRLVTIGIEPISEYLMFRTTFTSTTEEWYVGPTPTMDWYVLYLITITIYFQRTRVCLEYFSINSLIYNVNIRKIFDISKHFLTFFFIFIYFLGHRDTSLTHPTTLKIRNFAHIYKHLTWQYVRLGTNYGIFNKNGLLLPFS